VGDTVGEEGKLGGVVDAELIWFVVLIRFIDFLSLIVSVCTRFSDELILFIIWLIGIMYCFCLHGALMS